MFSRLKRPDFLRLAWPKHRCEPSEVYLRLARTNQNLPPTEAICPPIAISCDWGNRSTIDHPPKSFRARRDKIFCDWLDESMKFCAHKEKKTADQFFFCAGRDGSKNTPRGIFSANEVTEAKINADRNVFCVWCDKKFSRLAWHKNKCPPNENYWRLARPEKKWPLTAFISQLWWLKHDWPPIEVFSRLKPPDFFATGVTEVQMPAERSLFAIGANEAKLTADWSNMSADRNFLRLR